jgi:hypothetical protein
MARDNIEEKQGKEKKRISLRLPADIYEHIEGIANQEGISLTDATVLLLRTGIIAKDRPDEFDYFIYRLLEALKK